MDVKIGDVLYSAKEQPIMVIFSTEKEKELVAKMKKDKMEFVQFPSDQKYLANDMGIIRAWMQKQSIPARVYFGEVKLGVETRKAGGIIKKIEYWIEDLQRKNWGWPWHILFSLLMFVFVEAVLGIWVHDATKSAVFAGVFVSLVGLLNEIIQGESDKSEYWQDLLGNTIGIILGSLLIYAQHIAGGM